MEENTQAKWYVVKTFSGHENKVKNLIDAELRDNEYLDARIVEVLVPTEKIFEVKDADFETHHTLYDFSGTQVMDFIKALPNNLQCVMIVGHNYALTSLANMLGDVYIENIPTSGFVALTFSDTNWTNLNRGNTTLTVFPKDLKKAK